MPARFSSICFNLIRLFLLLFISHVANAQLLPGMRKFGRIEGYNATVGYNITQDRDGCIWVGSDNGAFQFNGNSFKTFNRETGLTDIEILDCSPYGKNHILFFALLNNMAYYTGSKIVNASQNRQLKTYNVRRNKVLRNKNMDTVWLSDNADADTLYQFSASGIQKISLGHKEIGIDYMYGNKILGHIPTLTGYRFITLNLKDKKVTPVFFPAHGKQKTPAERNIAPIIGLDGKFALYYNQETSIFDIYEIMDNNTLSFRASKHIDTKISHDCGIILDQDYNIWITVPRGGIYYIEDILHSEYEKKVFHCLKDYSINHIIRDRDKGIWLSTRNSCLLYITNNHFKNALRASRLSLPFPIVKYISGTGDGGIVVSYPGNDRLSHINKNTVRTIKLNDNFSEGVRYMLPLPDHNMIIIGNGIAYLNLKTLKITNPTIYHSAKNLCFYDDSTILFSRSFNAISVPISALLKDRLNLEKTSVPFYLGRAAALGVMSDKRILIGTPNGLLIKNSIQEEAFKVPHSVLKDANITSIVIWRNHYALIATNANGLFLYNESNGMLSEVRSPSNITHNSIRNIYLEKNSICWLSTDKGALRLVLDSFCHVREFYNYAFHDGLPSDNVTSVYAKNDTAYIATTEGIGVFYLSDTAHKKLTLPYLFVNTIEVQDTTFHHPSGSIHLSHLQNNLLLRLSAIAYESLDNVAYYYKLEGINDQWISTTNPEIRFAALPPGKYTLHAFATNTLGGRSEKWIKLNIIVHPAFWQSIYFNVAITLLGVIAIFILLHFWFSRNERKKQEKQLQKRHLAELELEAIKAQINPHFIYNCLNSIQYLNYKLDHINSQKYIDVFARLIRMTMIYAQQSFITVAEEIHYLGLYLQLEKLRLKDRLHYEIHMDKKLDELQKIPAMLIQPYVENALKHGISRRQAPGNVSVRFELHDTNLQITIEDDGPELPSQGSDNGTSLGLRLSRTRAESYNHLFGLDIKIHMYRKEITDPDKTGTIIIINIPNKTYEDIYI